MRNVLDMCLKYRIVIHSLNQHIFLWWSPTNTTYTSSRAYKSNLCKVYLSGLARFIRKRDIILMLAGHICIFRMQLTFLLYVPYDIFAHLVKVFVQESVFVIYTTPSTRSYIELEDKAISRNVGQNKKYIAIQFHYSNCNVQRDSILMGSVCVACPGCARENEPRFFCVLLRQTE